MNENILVFIEMRKGKIADVSLELLSEAYRLSKKLDNSLVFGVCASYQAEKELENLGEYGCKKVYYYDDKRLAHFSSLPYAQIVADTIREIDPKIVLFGATTTGRDIAPRVASSLECGLTADCTDLQIGDHEIKGKSFKNILLQIRPAFGGNIVATIVSPESRPSMASVREGVMKQTVISKNQKCDIEKRPCNLGNDFFMTQILEVVLKEKANNLKNAPVVVAAGMGASSSDAFNLIKELAEVLNAEIATSRPVVDAGLVPSDRQVGQTGLTVRPNLYIACGISGQIQHRAGMSDAKRIIAINSDPNAPIFSIAHYAIVGKVEEVLPLFIKAYKQSSEA